MCACAVLSEHKLCAAGAAKTACALARGVLACSVQVENRVDSKGFSQAWDFERQNMIRNHAGDKITSEEKRE